jgi:hypothetical protein
MLQEDNVTGDTLSMGENAGRLHSTARRQHSSSRWGPQLLVLRVLIVAAGCQQQQQGCTCKHLGS